MKKVLLGTSALIAAGLLAAPASAAEKIKLGLGGKMEQYFGVTNTDDNDDPRAAGDNSTFDLTSTGIWTDTEVYFSGATTLDNGLTVGAMIQLEAQSDAISTRNADEQYAYVEGAFGKIIAGQKDGVNAQLAHDAPQYGVAETDVEAFARFTTPNATRAPYFGANTITGGRFIGQTDTTISSDDASVSYISPSVAGFSLGLTWMPSPGGALQADTETSAHNQMQAALAYNGEFSGVSVGADVAYLRQEGAKNGILADNEDLSMWRAGLVVGYAGFQVGGSYMAVDNPTQRLTTATDDDLDVWNLGVGYKTGPYGVSLTYSQSNYELDSVAGVAPAARGGHEDTYQQWMLNGTYAMGPGVTAVASVFYAEAERNYDAVNTRSVEFDNAGAIVGLQLAF